MTTRLSVLLEVFLVSLKLGLTSFGGPIAHLGYFRSEYVSRRGWMDERSYADLVALCQFLPGPASSQVGIGIGTLRAGWLGGLAAWLGFTAPSVVALVLFAALLQGMNAAESGWIHGLKLVAVAIVAQAVIGMGQKLAAGRVQASLAIGAFAVALLSDSAYTQIAVLLAAGLFGYWRLRHETAGEQAELKLPIGKRFGAACLTLFAALLVLLPVCRHFFTNPSLALFDGFYRAGSLVFGGGHVVLPLLEREVISAGWAGKADFLAGYGAAQAVPGPLFTFASYLGMTAYGVRGAIVATAAIFLPAFLLVWGALPFWNELRGKPRLQGVLNGVNAAVVGILGAALYDPIWTSAVKSRTDLAFTAVLFGLLQFWRTPPWVVVVLGMAVGWIGFAGT